MLLYVALDNVVDTFNIGGFFRLVDACGVDTLFLLNSSAPPDIKIDKSSVNLVYAVDWYYVTSVQEIMDIVRQIEGTLPRLVGVEITENAIEFDKFERENDEPIVLFFGNEADGIRPEVLNQMHEVVYMPMYGINPSMNVVVSAAIALYWFRRYVVV